MAEGDLEKNAEFTQIFKKHDGEEDPVIVAQRFLNIFRQLHIFTAAKRKDFDDLLLQQPVSVRSMFAALPGGSVLQEYVNDLEQKSGVAKSTPTLNISASPEINEELSKAKILATALAEAQAQAHPHAQGGANQEEIDAITRKLHEELRLIKQELAEAKANKNSIDLSKLDKETLNEIKESLAQSAISAAPAISGPLTLVADESLKKDIGQILSQTLSANMKLQQQGNIEIAKIITESQNKLAQAIAGKDGGKTAEEIAGALAQIMEKNEESRRQGNLELAKVISESQAKIAREISAHGTASPILGEDGKVIAAPLPPLDSMIEGIVEKQSNLFKEMSNYQSDKLETVLSSALRESNQSSTQMIIDALQAFQKENLKILEMQTEIQKAFLEASRGTHPVYIQEQAAAPVFTPTAQSVAPTEDKIQPSESQDTTEARLSDSTASDPYFEEVADFSAEPYEQTDEEIPVTENILESNAEQAPEIQTADETASPLHEDFTADENVLFNEDGADFNPLNEITAENDFSAADTNGDETPKKKKKKKKKKKNKNTDESAEDMDMAADASSISMPDTAGSLTMDFPLLPEDADEYASLGLPEIADVPPTETNDDASGWGFAPVADNDVKSSKKAAEIPQFIEELPAEDSLTAETEDFSDNMQYVSEDDNGDGQDWEWEYVEDDGSEVSGEDAEYAAAENDESQNWEWEYTDGSSEDDGQEWEWEYVEDDSGEALPEELSGEDDSTGDNVIPPKGESRDDAEPVSQPAKQNTNADLSPLGNGFNFEKIKKPQKIAIPTIQIPGTSDSDSSDDPYAAPRR